jgi:hypothetical protein
MRSPTVEFKISPFSNGGIETGSDRQAAEHIAELLNALTPEQLALLDRRLQSAKIQTPTATHAEAALIRELTNGFQPNELERQELELTSLLRNFEWRRQLLADALSASEVAKALGTSRQTPHDRVKSGSLLAVLDRGIWRFPHWQFDPAGPDGVVNGFPKVLRALQVSPIAKASWFVRPNPYLDRITPIAALKRGDKERVIEQAQSVGVL